jgi:predicted dehydrogenase
LKSFSSRLDLLGRVIADPQVSAGLIGCGSHAFRNIVPTFQFASVRLTATCDTDLARAEAFATQFGAPAAYADHREMLEQENLDAVFLAAGVDEQGRPRYPSLALDCLAAGVHVWMEKPPAVSCGEIEHMQAAAASAGRHVMVGFKKMFAPANAKAKALTADSDFGRVALARLEYPQRIPTVDELRRFREDHEPVVGAIGFLDHFCHPASLLVYLMGMPDTMSYERSHNGAGVATFQFGSGALATLSFTWGGGWIDGMERTTIHSGAGRHVVVENNTRVEYHRLPVPGYGDVADFYTAGPETATAVWQPEFSLGQLYNKGLFLLGYYDEVAEFARSVLDGRPPARGTLDQARQVTRLMEAFADGPGTTIHL